MKLDLILSEPIVLFEGIKVGPGAIKQAIARNSESMNMGFEIEFVPHAMNKAGQNIADLSINDLSDYFQNTDPDPEAISEYMWEHIEDFLDIEELKDDFMDNHTRQNKTWYQDWLDENGYSDEELEDDPDQEVPDEDEVRNELKTGDLEDDIQEYVDEHVNDINWDDVIEHWMKADPVGFIQAMEWEFEYGYDMDYDGTITADTEGNIDEVAEDFQNHVEEEVIALGGYHDRDKEWHNWYVEPDSSVTNGLEISSPVKPVGESLADLEKTFEWLDDNEHDTTNETGLHISLSLPDMQADEEIDWVKLAVLMGEEYLLKEFDRLGNTYTNSHMKRIKDSLKDNNLEAFTSWEGYDKLKAELGKQVKGRESSFNITQFEETGRIEFRIMGNANYHQDFEKVQNGIGRYIMFLEIAKNPNAYKRQYITKLAKLLSANTEDSLKTSEEQMKNVDSDVKAWVRALGSAFGLDNVAIQRVKDLFQLKHVADQNPNSQEARTNVSNIFFSLFSYGLTASAMKAIKQEINTLVSESISFVDFLIEKQTSKLERMKLVSRKLAKSAGIDKEDYGNRFRYYPDDIVGQMRPEFGTIDDRAVLALLLFPDTEETFKEVINNGKTVMKLANQIKFDTAKKLFLEMLEMFSKGNRVNSYHAGGAIRNLIYFLQKETVKDDPEMKKVLKNMITSAEGQSVDVMSEIIKNTPGMENQQEAITYAHELMGREHPDITNKKKEELQAKEAERYRREQAVLNPPRAQQQQAQQVPQQPAPQQPQNQE